MEKVYIGIDDTDAENTYRILSLVGTIPILGGMDVLSIQEEGNIINGLWRQGFIPYGHAPMLWAVVMPNPRSGVLHPFSLS